MKQINLLKLLFFVSLFCISGVAGAQIHPLAFGAYSLGGGTTLPNWYADYVGLRFAVTTPAAIAGDKNYTTANDGSGATGVWGTIVTTPIVNVPIFMDTTSDSFGCSTFSPAAAATMHGKIAVIWRGPEGASACEFGCKAQYAQAAGAIAIVIINEYAGQGPIGMAASTTCLAPITIPVFMIGNLDGIAISEQYRAGVPVKMSISPWGLGYADDLGIIPQGGALWHNYAIPSNQLNTNAAFKGEDGAFIANFGTDSASGLKLKGSLSFTPNGGTTTVQHMDSVTYEGTFNSIDSIEAMFDTLSEYNISGSGVGRYDLTYTLSSNFGDHLSDQYPADNTLTNSFYATDSLYSKGTYDFTNNAPVFGSYESFGTAPGNEFIWGPMYFVGSQAGTSVSRLQFSLYQNGTGTLPATVYLAGAPSVYIFEWNDTSNDGIVQNGELTLVSSSAYNFGPEDTSGALLQLSGNSATAGNYIGDASGNPGATVFLDTNSWYYVAVDVPGSTFLGVDGKSDPYPRIFGRFHASGTIDYNNIETSGGDGPASVTGTPGAFAPSAASSVGYVNSIDSFIYSGQKGLIPQVAMIVNNSPDREVVNNVSKPFGTITTYPNPATDVLNVTVNLDQNSKTVSYLVMDGLGRFVSRITHNNVQNETVAIPTSALASGNYYLSVNVNGQVRVKKFTVVH